MGRGNGVGNGVRGAVQPPPPPHGRTVSESSGFRSSLRKRKATTGMMHTTVVRAMVSQTVGCANVFCALPGGGGGRSREEGGS